MNIPEWMKDLPDFDYSSDMLRHEESGVEPTIEELPYDKNDMSFGDVEVEEDIPVKPKNGTNGHKVKIGNGPSIIEASLNKNNEEVDQPIEPGRQLPPLSGNLLKLPYGLGKIQNYIFNRMIYPDMAIAGMTALSLFGHFAKRNVTINSYSGLGLNEQFMILAGTTFGKEDIRNAFYAFESKLNQRTPVGHKPSLAWSAPSSLQGLHKMLEDNSGTTFLSDEFAEWLSHTANDSHKQQALGYLMQCYTKALGTVCPGSAVTNSYTPVANPRVSLLTTSTIDRMLEIMTASHANSGVYNRFVIFVADDKKPEKRYKGFQYEIPNDCLNLLYWLTDRHNVSMGFDQDAWDTFERIDSQIAEPLKDSDPVLSGRLSEQSIKMAGLIALSDHRTTITSNDLEIAYDIRFSLYHRVSSLVKSEYSLSSLHETSKAKDQLADALKRREWLYKSQFPFFSRAYKSLSTRDRASVYFALINEGIIEEFPDCKAKVISKVCTS